MGSRCYSVADVSLAVGDEEEGGVRGGRRLACFDLGGHCGSAGGEVVASLVVGRYGGGSFESCFAVASLGVVRCGGSCWSDGGVGSSGSYFAAASHLGVRCGNYSFVAAKKGLVSYGVLDSPMACSAAGEVSSDSCYCVADDFRSNLPGYCGPLNHGFYHHPIGSRNSDDDCCGAERSCRRCCSIPV